MEGESAPDVTLTIRHCKGRIWDSGNSIDAVFDLTVDTSGKTRFETALAPIAADSTWLLDTGRSAGRLVTPISFEGHAPDGRLLRSDSFFATWHEILGSDLRIGGHLSQVTLQAANSTLPSSAAGADALYRVAGIRGLGTQKVTTSCGELVFSARSKLEREDDLSGLLEIKASADETRSIDDWLEACDKECRRMLEVLSLVEGRFFTAGARDLRVGDRWVRSEIWEPSPRGAAAEPLWYSLDLLPFVEVAARGYTETLRESRGLDVAIESFFAHSSYLEVKLVTVQTTLEYLVGAFERANALSGSVLSKDEFTQHVRPKMEAAIDEVIRGLPTEIGESSIKRAEELFDAKLGGLNALTIRERLFRMLGSDGVPYAGLELPIRDAIRTRGGTVHGRGTSPGQSSEYVRHIAVLRELVKRIFLTLVGYKGRYISYLNGSEDVDFPPTTATVVKP